EWLFWAKGAQIHPSVRAYVEADASAFDSPFSNPRSWCDVSDLLKAKGEAAFPPALLQAVIAGCVGAERRAAFCGFLADRGKALGAADVLCRYPACREVLRGWVKKGRLDLVAGTLLNVQKSLQSRGEFHAVHEHQKSWANLALFLADLP